MILLQQLLLLIFALAFTAVSGDRYGAGGPPPKAGIYSGEAFGRGLVANEEQSVEQLEWAHQFSTGMNNWNNIAHHVMDRSSNTIAVGTTQQSLYEELRGLTEVTVIKYASGGEVIWATQFGALSASDEATNPHVCVDSYDHIYVAFQGTSAVRNSTSPVIDPPPAEVSASKRRRRGRSSSHAQNNRRVHLVKLAPQGEKLWEKRFEDETLRSSEPSAIICSGSGAQLYIGGRAVDTVVESTGGATTRARMLLYKVDTAQSDLLWKEYYPNYLATSQPRSLAENAETGDVYALASYERGAAVALMQISAVDGVVRNEELVRCDGGRIQPESVAVDSAGYLYVVTSSQGCKENTVEMMEGSGGAHDVVVMKFDRVPAPTGDSRNRRSQGRRVLWTAGYGGEGEEGDGRVFHDVYGNVYITYSTESPSLMNFVPKEELSADISVALIDPNSGSIITKRIFGTCAPDYPSDVTIDEKSNLYLTGVSHANLEVVAPRACFDAEGQPLGRVAAYNNAQFVLKTTPLLRDPMLMAQILNPSTGSNDENASGARTVISSDNNGSRILPSQHHFDEEKQREELSEVQHTLPLAQAEGAKPIPKTYSLRGRSPAV